MVLNSSVVIPVIIAFIISVMAGPLIIPFLKRLHVGQTEREEGPKSHLKKTGTPTMGGILILASGLGILGIKQIKTLNLLPALLVPPAAIALLSLFGI